MLINHYLRLVQHEGEIWSMDMIVRAGLDRLAPVLMTSLTSEMGLVPLGVTTLIAFMFPHLLHTPNRRVCLHGLQRPLFRAETRHDF